MNYWGKNIKYKIKMILVKNKTGKIILSLYNRIIRKFDKGYRLQNSLFLQNGTDTLIYLKKCLDQVEVPFWLTAGTLLGAYREKKFLGYDLDIDVAVFEKHQSIIQEILTANGFKLLSEFGIENEGIKEQSYYYNNTKIDIFFTEQKEKYFINYVFFKECATDTLDDFHVIEMLLPETDFIFYEFLGSQFLIPQKTEEYLIANYGPSFMVPNKYWNYTRDIFSAIYHPIDKKCGYQRIH